MPNQQERIDSYIAQMNDQEKKVLQIAIDHLQSSFDIVKSIGFQEWIKTQGD
jgi:endonuclease IV